MAEQHDAVSNISAPWRANNDYWLNMRGEAIGLPQAVTKLLDYCQSRNWSGHDPYDALNSELLSNIRLLDRRVIRIALTQLLKRSPLDFRSMLRVPPTQNPKALALFLVASLKLGRMGMVQSALAQELCDRILLQRSPLKDYWCWGYSFPWQTRTVLVPRNAPNLVCTTFVVGALLDFYEQTGTETLLTIAQSAANYVVEQLYFEDQTGAASFAYPLPEARAKVHNANLLAGAMLARVFHYTSQPEYLKIALRAARYAVSKQNQDGFWWYGESPSQQWIDNFHTGYNLSALRTINQSLQTNEFDRPIQTGFSFYRNHFIRNDGAARYFHNRTYPIDSHCVAQTILTLLEFEELDPAARNLARSVYQWAVQNMGREEGFFAYRKLRWITIPIPYMRWSQAWMLLALTTLLEKESQHSGKNSHSLMEPAVA